MKKIGVLALVLVLALGVLGGMVMAKEWDLGKQGNLEVTSYLTTVVKDLSDPSLDVNLAGEAKYTLPLAERLVVKVEDKLVFEGLQEKFERPVNALSIFAEYDVTDKVLLKGGIKFDNDWENLKYAELRVTLF